QPRESPRPGRFQHRHTLRATHRALGAACAARDRRVAPRRRARRGGRAGRDVVVRGGQRHREPAAARAQAVHRGLDRPARPRPQGRPQVQEGARRTHAVHQRATQRHDARVPRPGFQEVCRRGARAASGRRVVSGAV
ncbi:hypothetical protein BN1723_017432, partial [Verticillium longisporum]